MEGEGRGNEKWTILKKSTKAQIFTPNSFPIEISEGRGSYLQLVIVPCVEMERFHLLDWNNPKRLVLNFESVELIYSSWTKRHDGICKNSVWLYCDGGSSSIRLQKICVGGNNRGRFFCYSLSSVQQALKEETKGLKKPYWCAQIVLAKKKNISNEYRKGQLSIQSVRNRFLLLLPVKRKFFLSTVTKVLSDS